MSSLASLPGTPHVFSTPKLPTKSKKLKSSSKKKKAAKTGSSKISVYCRPRPISTSTCILGLSDTKVTLVNKNAFTYDHIFNDEASQNEVYEKCAKPVIEAFMREQRSGLLFCYGVSGSGKTFTIEGNDQHPGIVPKLMRDLFSTQLSPNISILLSYFEIYQEKVYDLMEDIKFDPYTQKPMKRKNLKITEGKDGFIDFVALEDGSKREMKKIELTKLTDALQIWRHGRENRSVSGTALNGDSSRSHGIFMVRMFEKISKSSEREVARLSIVDLAGSERIVRSKPTQEQQTEAGAINNSLISLSEYLKTIRANQSIGKSQTFVPCRGSKLTRLFQDTFTKNRSMVRVIVNINPDAAVINETENALKFGAIANTVDTAPLSAIKSASKRTTDLFVSPRLLAPIGNSTTPRFNSHRKKNCAIRVDENTDMSTCNSMAGQENQTISITAQKGSTTPIRTRTPRNPSGKKRQRELSSNVFNVLSESNLRNNIIQSLEPEFTKVDKIHDKSIESLRLQFEKREERQKRTYMGFIERLRDQANKIVAERNGLVIAKEKEIEALQQSVAALKDEIKTKSSDSEDNAEELEELHATIESKESEILSLKHRIANIELESRSQLQEKEAQIQEIIRQKNEETRELRDQLTSQRTEFENERKSFRKNAAQMKSEMETLQKQLEEDRKNRTQTSKISKPSKMAASTKDTTKKLKEQLKKKLEQEFEKKLKDMEAKREAEMAKKIQELEQQKQLALKEKEQQLELAAQQHRDELKKHSEETAKTLSTELKQLEQELQNLTELKKKAESDYQEQIELHNSEKEALLDQIDELKTQLVSPAKNIKKTKRVTRKKTATKKQAAAPAKSFLSSVISGINTIMSPSQSRKSTKRKLKRFSTVQSEDEANESDTVELEDLSPAPKRRKISEKKAKVAPRKTNTKKKVPEDIISLLDDTEEEDSPVEEEDREYRPSVSRIESPVAAPAPSTRRVLRRKR